MKKKKYRLINIRDPLFHFNIGFVYGGTHDDYRRIIEGNTGEKIAEAAGTNGAFHTNHEKGMYLLWLPLKSKLSVIGHEIIHLTYSMFESRGLKPTRTNDELFAYYWEWWFEEITFRMKMLK